MLEKKKTLSTLNKRLKLGRQARCNIARKLPIQQVLKSGFMFGSEDFPNTKPYC